MDNTSYWTNRLRRRLSRRGLLGAGAWGATGLTGASSLGGLACGGTKKSGQGTSAIGQSGTPATKEPPRPGGVLNVYTRASYPLDPHKTPAQGQQVPGGTMSRVFRFKTGPDPNVIADHTTEPDLGISAESPDALTWTVKLRPDAKFQPIPPVNGHAVEAEDIRATFTRILDPATLDPNRSVFDMIDPAQIQTPDGQTAIFKLRYSYAPFRNLLAAPAYSWIVPREALAGAYDLSKTVIGSGPFILEIAQPDVAYTFKRNPDWFDKPRPYVDGLRVAVIPDGAQQLAQFTAGNLDHMELSNPANLAAARQGSPKAAVYKTAWGVASNLFFQLGDPSSAFQDIRIRRAFSMAIDRDALGKAFFDGEAVQMIFVPAFMGKWALPVQALNPSVQQFYKYNPTEARKLLEAAGQTGLQVRFANYFLSTGAPDSAKLAEAVNAMLNAVGIKSTIVNIDFNKEYFGTGGRGIKNGYFDKDMVPFLGGSFFTEPDAFLYGFFHSKSVANVERVKDPVLDEMIDKQRALVNEEDRVKAVLDVQRYLAEQMYVPSTVGSYRWELVQPRVRNYSFSDSSGLYTENYAKVWLAA